MMNEDLDNIYKRLWFAEDETTTPEILTKLAEDENWGIRAEVAENNNTPAEVLRRLAEDENVYVRGYVAENINTPVKALHTLSKDKSKYVRNVARTALSRRSDSHTPEPDYER